MTQLINSEKEKYNEIYTKLVFSVDDLKQLLDEPELKKRSFIVKLETLKDYMNFLDELSLNKPTKKGLFSRLLKKNEDTDLRIHTYLNSERRLQLSKLTKCAECKCISCVSNCSMNQCLNCRENEFVNDCNKDDSLLTISDETVTLYNNDGPIHFRVAAALKEKDNNGNYSRYVYLIDNNDNDNQHILRYSKFKGEESYDSVISDDSQDELIRINDKFIELGLRV